jgi:hypothetical protein
MGLAEYQRKRDFSRTPEPIGAGAQDRGKQAPLRFVVRGRWMLVRIGRQRIQNYWLLIKEHDVEARPGSGDAVVTKNQGSIASGRDIAAVAAARDRVWQ